MSDGFRYLSRLACAILAGGVIAVSATPTFAQPPTTVRAIKLAQPAQDVQIMFDVRVVSVDEDGVERIGVDFESRPTPEAISEAEKVLARATASNPVFLTEKQRAALVESWTRNPRVSVLTAPKITTLDGQTASFAIGEEVQHAVCQFEPVQHDGQTVYRSNSKTISTGLKLQVAPVVSADRHSIRVNVKVAETECVAPASGPTSKGGCCVGCPTDGKCAKDPTVNTQLIEKTVVVLDGWTAVFLGPKKSVQVQSEYGPPGVASIPYLNRLFRSVGYVQETRQMIVLVTPHIITNEPAEMPTCPKAQAGYSGLRVSTVNLEKIALFELTEECATKVVPPQARMEKVVADLVKAYREACAEGHTEEAEKLARAALLLDPTCFAKK